MMKKETNNKLKISDSYQKKLWKKEVEKRKKFGISSETFYGGYGNNYIRFCSLSFKRDFQTLYSCYVSRKDIKKHSFNTHIKNNIDLFVDTFLKYKDYTFQQLEEANGALQLSKVCGLVHILEEHKIEYKDKKIEIFYRLKDAATLSCYPEKVKIIFQTDRYCRAVAFLYKEPNHRIVFLEKYDIRRHRSSSR